MQKEVEILKGQNLADVAVQETGWFEGIYCIAINNGIGMTDIVAPGTNLNVADSCINKSKYRLTAAEGIEPATEFDFYEENEEPIQLGGIGNMAIGIDFVVS